MKFNDERSKPTRHLLAALEGLQPLKIVDLGCGPGNSTVLIRESFPKSQVEGIDSSQAMIGSALALGLNATFKVADISTWHPPADVDLLFSNAVFHWVPDHPHHMYRLLAALKPGAALAVQMPDNLSEPSHELMRALAQTQLWAFNLLEISRARAPLLQAHQYRQLLRPLASKIEIWKTTYHHLLPDHRAIADMLSTTGLKPYLDVLSPKDKVIFVEDYVTALKNNYPANDDGSVLYPFPRLFIVAIREGS